MEMSYKYREELVGKRFLSVSGVPKLSVSKISDWGWKAGVIRASSHKDNKNKDLQVLVEYDDEGWRRRQWLQVYTSSFSIFLVEEELVWAPKGSKPFPALKFIALKSIPLGTKKPVEFLIDHELIFVEESELEDFQDWEAQGEAGQAARRWARRQQAQRVLSRCSSALGGCRAQVYRARGATQWYTAVIVGCNQETGELTVTDDTVLEEHNEDPALVQMRLLGDGVVESIMRGESVGMLPRRSRSGAQHAKFEDQSVRVSNRTATRTKKPSALVPALQPNEKGSKKKKKKRKASDKVKFKSKVVKKVVSKKEDIENKKKKRSESLSLRKKVLVDDVNNKIGEPEEKVQQVQLEESEVVIINNISNASNEVDGYSSTATSTDVTNSVVSNSDTNINTTVPISCSSSTSEVVLQDSDNKSASNVAVSDTAISVESTEVIQQSKAVQETELEQEGKESNDQEPIEQEPEPDILEETLSLTDEVQSVQRDAVEITRETETSPQLLEDAARMEEGSRFPDDRSDSGVSSLRSASGDERSGSRSSALSVPEEHESPRGMAHPAGPSPAPAPVAPRAPPHITQQMPAHLQNHLPYPPSMLHLPPPEHFRHDMIWKKYQEDIERERIFRSQQLLRPVPFTEADLMLGDPSQRLFAWHRERQREQEVRELESQQIKERDRLERLEREREKAEREHEKERQEKAVHKHFEDSLRLANQKRERTPTWSVFSSLTPPGRGGQPPPQQPSQPPTEDQRGLNNDRLRAAADVRDRNYYTQPPLQQRPPSAPSKNDYPPPAHSRLSINPKPLEKSIHIGLPKAEPNFSIYSNYANYHHPVGYMNHDVKIKPEHLNKVQIHKNSVGKPLSSVVQERDPINSLPTPPPLVSEIKNSVIVKHEAKLPSHHLEIKTHPAHSPKLRGGELGAYYHNINPLSYRGAPPQTQPPPPQRNVQTIPPASRPRQEPYSRPPSGHAYHPPPAAPPPPSKPKVSSPAPPHFYGKPTSGITSGIPVCRSQEPPVAVNAIPLTSKANSPSLYRPPPPAHSRGDPRPLLPPGASPPAGYPAPQPIAYQTQPLDLGISSDRDDGDRSPKRRGTPIQNISECSILEKKRKLEPTGPPFQMESIQQYPAANTSPQLSRVSEPTPLIASAATTITTMVNTAAYCTSPAPPAHTDSPVRIPSADGAVRPPSVPRPLEKTEPELSTTPAPPTVAPCPSPLPPVTPIKVPSPPMAGSPKESGAPVRHLKKAWLQRHETAPEAEKEAASAITTAAPTVTVVTRPSETLSLQNVGSMAINSIIRNKPIKVARKAQKETNGHIDDSRKMEYSSSSDQEQRNCKVPPKRKTSKVKRKKGNGGKKSSDDGKKKKNSVVLSESGSESDKESNSDKDSDSGASLNHSITVRKSTNSNSSSSNGKEGKEKEPRKRGRRPKSLKNDKNKDDDNEPIRNKKSKDDPPNPSFPKPPVSQLKKTGQSFLQDGTCYDVAPKLAKCRECRWTPNQRSKNMSNIFCRFYAFRKLRYTKNGQLAIAGFSDPNKDPSEEDSKLWLQPSGDCELDIEMSCFLLRQIGDQFCDLLKQESETKNQNLNEDKTIAWKRVVQGTREMCDVCETTIFNYHWACGKCGFMVCLDCYKSRTEVSSSPLPGISGAQPRERDEYGWLTCTSRAVHDAAKLMLTQIVAGNALTIAEKALHQTRKLWSVPQGCDCKEEALTVSPTQARFCRKLLREAVLGNVKKMKEEEKKGKDSSSNGSPKNRNTAISWLADVALKTEDKAGDDTSSSDSDGEGNFSTLRELLIRPNKPSSGSSSPSSTNGKHSKKPRLDNLLDDVISCVIENKSDDKDGEMDVKSFELKHFVRRYNRSHASGRDQLPTRIMTHIESSSLYPDTPHSWLCDGKLLRLLDPTNSGNYRIFQDQWKRGQPVIVSGLMKFLDKDMWTPESFSADFGEEKNDLINCLTGNIVPNQPMKKFWDGFDHTSKRLKDESGEPMLLKLKDWPPGEDFSELLPTRFNNLMKCLPMQEYTHRTGKLNLASRLPDSFVRPDLGPKMYTAYGSALYPGHGTTNLHLDVSDAVNVMVHVSGPKDTAEQATREAFRAIDEAGCDILTRRRVREKGEIPGALWHIYNPRDADKIRDLLNKIAIEKGAHPQPHHDPIHDQSCYLDAPLRERLYKEYRVEGYAIVQCLGDAVFVPAGAPHQVRNLNDCIKVAEDFVSPENISHCFHLTQEFRDLTDTHTNHEDKLQIKNIIYHAVKDSLDCLKKAALEAAESSSADSDSKDEVKKEVLP